MILLGEQIRGMLDSQLRKEGHSAWHTQEEGKDLEHREITPQTRLPGAEGPPGAPVRVDTAVDLVNPRDDHLGSQIILFITPQAAAQQKGADPPLLQMISALSSHLRLGVQGNRAAG